MARKRMIDPEFWLDEELALLSFQARLLYIGLWNICDDNHATLPNRPDWIKAQIFPYEALNIHEHLLELQSCDKIIEFKLEGQSYWYIKNFFKYQKVDHPSKPKYPKFVAEASVRPRPQYNIIQSNLIKSKPSRKGVPRDLLKRIIKTPPNPEVIRLMEFFTKAVKIIRSIEPPVLNTGKVGAILKRRLDIDKIAPDRIESMTLWYLTREKKFKDNRGNWQTTFKNAPDMAVMLSDAYLSSLLSDEANIIIYMRDNFDWLDKIYKKIQPQGFLKVGGMESLGSLLTKKKI